MKKGLKSKFNIKNPLSSLLTGRFLVSEGWQKNWPFILYLSLLAMIMISSSHQADKKVHQIAKLQSNLKELSSEYTDTRSRLMQKSMKTEVIEKAIEINLIESEKPPIKITVD